MAPPAFRFEIEENCTKTDPFKAQGQVEHALRLRPEKSVVKCEAYTMCGSIAAISEWYSTTRGHYPDRAQ
jgi:hypothetical protein